MFDVRGLDNSKLLMHSIHHLSLVLIACIITPSSFGLDCDDKNTAVDIMLDLGQNLNNAHRIPFYPMSSIKPFLQCIADNTTRLDFYLNLTRPIRPHTQRTRMMKSLWGKYEHLLLSEWCIKQREGFRVTSALLRFNMIKGREDKVLLLMIATQYRDIPLIKRLLNDVEPLTNDEVLETTLYSAGHDDWDVIKLVLEKCPNLEDDTADMLAEEASDYGHGKLADRMRRLASRSRRNKQESISKRPKDQ